MNKVAAPVVQPAKPGEPGEQHESGGAEAVPGVWEMPATGIEWCDCGEHHPVTEQVVRDAVARALGAVPEGVMTHIEVCETLMELWNYVEVCAFFHDQVYVAAQAVYGRVAAEYPVKVALEIIGYFTKTWNGCPEEACRGGFFAEGPEWEGGETENK